MRGTDGEGRRDYASRPRRIRVGRSSPRALGVTRLEIAGEGSEFWRLREEKGTPVGPIRALMAVCWRGSCAHAGELAWEGRTAHGKGEIAKAHICSLAWCRFLGGALNPARCFGRRRLVCVPVTIGPQGTRDRAREKGK